MRSHWCWVPLLVLLSLTPLFAQQAPPAAQDKPTVLPATKINPKDGAEMVLIPAGEFLMGTSEEELAAWLKAHPDREREYYAHDMPQHKVDLDAYYMYTTEVTVAQYRKFCQATKRQMPPEPAWKWQDTHPIVNVSWEDAKAYAAWAGVLLPTEAQWEKAARGGDRRVFPWGDAWPPPKGAGNFADQTMKASGGVPGLTYIDGYTDGYVYTSPVGAFAANPYGIHDLAGNVWEWCADWYDGEYYQPAPQRNPTGPATGDARVLRGGAWDSTYPVVCRAAVRYWLTPGLRGLLFGFRCVLRSPGP